MNKYITIRWRKAAVQCFIPALLALQSDQVFAQGAQPANTWLVVVNTASFSRQQEVIVVNRDLLDPVNNRLVPQVRRRNTTLVSQPIDTNRDGSWDALLVEISMAAHASDTLQVLWVAQAAAQKATPVTGIRLSLRSDSLPSANMEREVRKRSFVQNIAKPYYQLEGPGIENDKVAFRAFFDSRNGKDVYGKITGELVLEKVGVGATWHELQPWGMDILKVGNSLGAGALAVEQNDRLYRLADADQSVFQSLYQGALQAAFGLRFTNWDVGDQKKNGAETVSVTKGDFYYRNDISLALNNQRLVAGLANFGMGQAVYKKHNQLYSSISTYGNQAEGTQTRLGLAIMFSAADYVTSATTDTSAAIPNTSYVVLKAAGGSRHTIRFFACWEKTDRRFATAQGFRDYLQSTAAALANPIQIKSIKKQR